MRASTTAESDASKDRFLPLFLAVPHIRIPLRYQPSPPLVPFPFRPTYHHPLAPGVISPHCAAHKSALEYERVAAEDRVVGGSLPIRPTSQAAVGEQSCTWGPELAGGP